MINRDNYINIQGWMVTDLGLKGNELLIYAIIYGFSQDGESEFNGSASYLAQWTNSSKQGIFKSLKKLVEKNLIIKKEIWKNKVKFVYYQTTKFIGGDKQSLSGGDKQSLPNNIDNNKLDNIYSTKNNQDKNQVANQDKNQVANQDANQVVDIDIDNNKYNNKILNEYFTAFYSKYPNKKSKQKAYTIFCAILKNKKATFEQLMEGLNKYVAYINQNKIEKSYIKHPTTWLNQGCWEDEYEESGDSWKGNPLLADFCEEMTKRDVERAKAEGML